MRRTAFLVLLVVLVPASWASSCPKGGTWLQVLGSGGSRLQDRHAGSAYLLWIHSQSRLLVNSGDGSSLRFRQSNASFTQLDVIALSHLHANHTASLPGIIGGARQQKRKRPLPVFGPSGSKTMPSTVAFIRTLFDQRRGAWRELGSVLSPLASNGFKLEPHDIHVVITKGTPRLERARKINPVFHNEHLKLTAAAGKVGAAPALAWRADTVSGAVVFLDDTADKRLLPFARGADLMVAPVPAVNSSDHGRSRIHANELGRLANSAGIRHLVLVHRDAPDQKQERTALAELGQWYSGKISLARDLACYSPQGRTTTTPATAPASK